MILFCFCQTDQSDYRSGRGEEEEVLLVTVDTQGGAGGGVLVWVEEVTSLFL